MGNDVWQKYPAGPISHETANPISGTGSIKSVAGDAGYAFQQFVYSATWNAQPVGTYFVEFDIKPVKNVNAAVVMIYVSDSARISQVGVLFTLDGDVATDATIVDGSVAGGWNETNYQNAKVTALGDGAFRVYFEYVVGADVPWDNTSWPPYITFAQRATVANDNAVIWDNISFGKVVEPTYYSIDWDVSYSGLTSIWNEQPIWANSFEIVADHFGTGEAYKMSANGAGNTQIGGLENRADNMGAHKAFKQAGVNYVQYDIDVEGFTMFNMWSSATYTAIIFNGTDWHSEGNVTGFVAQKLTKGWRISYSLDLTDYRDMEFNINVSGSGSVYFDNFVIAHVDTTRAPWVSGDKVSYLYPAANDVTVDVDVKGKEVLALERDGIAIAADLYSVANGTLTIKAATFADAQKGQDFTFTLKTAGGSKDISVAQVSTLIDVAAVGPTQPITKYFDNNAEVKEHVALSLSGVLEGDEVTVSYTDAVYVSAAEGDVDVRVSGIKLAGKDAYKYNLASDTIIVSGKILPLIQVTAVAPAEAIVKYEDGTTNANAQITLALQGVLEGDEVTVSYTSVVFDSAEVGATTLTISGLKLGGKDAAKYTLANTTVSANGTILARTELTVSADTTLVTKRYDGTTVAGDIALKLEGVAAGDDVVVSATAAFDSAEAGERQVVVSNITLAGADAFKYTLSSTTLTIDGWISELKQIAASDNSSYYTVDGKTLVDIDLGNYSIGSASGSVVSGLYIGTTAEIVDGGTQNILKVTKACDVWATELFATNTTGTYRTPGVYAVYASIKPVNSTMITITVRNTYDNNTSGILADFRWNVMCDENGNATAISKDVGGWTGIEQKYFNGKAELNPETGWIDCYFEFVLPAGINFQDGYMPNVTFMGANAAGATSEYYFTSIKYLCVSNADKYFTKDFDLDFENAGETPQDVTPFWGTEGLMIYDTEWTTSTTVMYIVAANSGRDTQIGGLNNDEGKDIKLFKGHGLHYVQYDFDTTCQWVNLYSHGDNAQSFVYFSVQCNNNEGALSFTTEGAVRNFKAVKLENDMYRISFYVDMTGSSYDRTWIQINAQTGSDGGEVIFDNLFVAHEDYAPIANNATYNYFETDDVVVSADVKGAKLTAVILDGEAVASDLYSYNYATGTLTLSKTLFAGAQLDAADRALKLVTLDGEVTVALSIVDNRPDSVTVDTTETELQVGQSTTVVADAIRDVVWSTSDATVATVENGVIVAVGVGTATITATSGTASATVVVTVVKAPAQPSEELAQAVAAIESANGTEAKFNAIKAAISIYNALEEDVKEASAADVATLQAAIAAYNAAVTATNNEMTNAISNCISYVVLALAAGAVLFLLKRKLF